LGQDIIVDGTPVHYAQKHKKDDTDHDQHISSTDYKPSPSVKGMGMDGHADLGFDMNVPLDGVTGNPVHVT
jgi:hypothetical protein